METIHELTATQQVQHDKVNDSPLGEGYTSRSDETSEKKLNELTERCTKLEASVLNLQKLSVSQTKEIAQLKFEIQRLKDVRRTQAILRRVKQVRTT